MERDLFDWSEWDGDQGCMIFYNSVLKVQIGEYPPGTKFNFINLLNILNSGRLQLGQEDGSYVEYELKYQVGKKTGTGNCF